MVWGRHRSVNSPSARPSSSLYTALPSYQSSRHTQHPLASFLRKKKQWLVPSTLLFVTVVLYAVIMHNNNKNGSGATLHHPKNTTTFLKHDTPATVPANPAQPSNNDETVNNMEEGTARQHDNDDGSLHLPTRTPVMEIDNDTGDDDGSQSASSSSGESQDDEYDDDKYVDDDNDDEYDDEYDYEDDDDEDVSASGDDNNSEDADDHNVGIDYFTADEGEFLDEETPTESSEENDDMDVNTANSRSADAETADIDLRAFEESTDHTQQSDDTTDTASTVVADDEAASSQTDDTDDEATEAAAGEDDASSSFTTTTIDHSEPSLVDIMLRDFQEARLGLHNQLALDYGPETAAAIFHESIGRNALVSPTGKGWQRLVRKIKIKVLRGLVSRRRQTRLKDHDDRRLDRHFEPFVWATGGHSAAAGHGNHFNESYTSYMEQAVQGIFATAGVQFIGRNYAMGGTSSGPEVAFCVDSIFGLDIDVLSWDFGMTDGRSYGLMELYFQHAGMNPGRPAAVAMIIGGRGSSGHYDILQHLEDIGVPALYLKEETRVDATNKIPDSAGRTEEELEAMPPFVRHYKCGGGIETGDPYCGQQKFNQAICEKRKFKTSWHPGWKWHALHGRLAAMSLIDMLEDALLDVKEYDQSKLDTYLGILQAEEDGDWREFAAAPISDLSTSLPGNGGNIDSDILFKTRGICHTGRLPAETRFLGILTETDEVTDVYTYHEAMSKTAADANPNQISDMRLVFEDDERQECAIPLNLDFKDYWYTRSADGRQSITLPNDRELSAYRTTADEPLRGVIALCLAGCSWGKCPPGDIRETDVIESADISVNAVAVVSVTSFGECMFLHHEGGLNFDPNDRGKFEIGVTCKREKSFLRISSFVIW